MYISITVSTDVLKHIFVKISSLGFSGKIVKGISVHPVLKKHIMLTGQLQLQ